MNEHQQRAEDLVDAFLADADPALPPDEAPRAFAAFATARGANVRLVQAEDGDHPAHPSATWVRVFNVEGIHGYDVDPAVARFGDPSLPPALVWRMDGAHPVAGVYRTLRVTRPEPPA